MLPSAEQKLLASFQMPIPIYICRACLFLNVIFDLPNEASFHRSACAEDRVTFYFILGIQQNSCVNVSFIG